MENGYFWKKDKIMLRAMKESDAEELYEGLCDTTLRMQADGGIALPVTFDVAADMIDYALEMTMEGSQLWFAVVDMENSFVGYAILGYINERDGNAQCDVAIFPEFENLGYEKSVLDILLRYAFCERRLQKVNSFILEGNTQGEKALIDSGFVKEAYREAQFYSGGKYLWQKYYGITKDEFLNPSINRKEAEEIPFETTNSIEVAERLKQLKEERPYFWLFDNIILREMLKEDYLKNREMLFLSKDARFYDNDVKLPPLTEGLTEKEETHLHFGGDGTRLEFAVLNLKGEYVGNVNLHSIDRKNGTFSISFYFLNNERNKGYATKAVALVVYYAFYEMRLNKLNVCVNEGNFASQKVIQNIGCIKEGIWRENVFYDGKYVNVWLYGMTKDFFESYLQN